MSVRLNTAELAELDGQRAAAGGLERGVQIRLAWSGAAPVLRIPEANQEAYAALARSSANLTQIDGHLPAGFGPTRRDLNEAADLLERFRAGLLFTLRTASPPAGAAGRVEAAAGRHERRLRRGPYTLPKGERRDHVVAVRLSAIELAELDAQRQVGNAKRGEWLRMTWEDLIPQERIPAISAAAYQAVARSAENLNGIAKYLNEGGEVKGRVPLITQEVRAFVANLRRAESSKE